MVLQLQAKAQQLLDIGLVVRNTTSISDLVIPSVVLLEPSASQQHPKLHHMVMGLQAKAQQLLDAGAVNNIICATVRMHHLLNRDMMHKAGSIVFLKTGH